MPFYEYECSACKFYVEALQKISEPPMKKCPSCGKETLQRLISAPVFRLKGAGWYETDFKSDKENKRNLADASADDKAPVAAADGDDKKIKVRASKALAKVAAKKAAVRPGRKPAAKPVKQPLKKLAKPAKKTAVKSVAKKLPAKKGPAAKRPTKKLPPKKHSVAKAAKKAANKQVARKK